MSIAPRRLVHEGPSYGIAADFVDRLLRERETALARVPARGAALV